MLLPYFHTTNKDLTLLQNKYKSILDPIISNQTNQVRLLDPVKLVSGTNVINHLLQEKQSGWVIYDIDGPATIYRSAPFNELTLTLTSNAAVTIILGVY